MKKILHLLKFISVFLLIHTCFNAYAVLGDGNELSVDFNLIVGRYNATTQVFTPLALGETIAQNEIITVRVVPQSDFLVGNTSFVMMFDKVLFTIVGANRSAFTVNTDTPHIDYDNIITMPGYTGNYYYDFACSSYNGSTTIPDASWPASFAAGERYDVYKAIKCVFMTDSNSLNGGYPELLPGTWLFQFRLTATQNIIVGTDARIWMDTRWYRSSTNTNVDGYIVKCTSGSMSSSGSTVYPFTFDFIDSDIKLSLSSPSSTSTITFDVAGGTPSIAPITQEEGTPVTAPADPTKTGFTFLGWSPELPATMPVDDMTCAAQWEAIPNPTSTISFDSDGGSPIAPITQDEGTAVTSPADPTKTGFTFQGWVPTVPATMPVDDLTCVAQWQQNTSTITFNSDGGTAVAPITGNIGDPVTPPADPTRNGYTFNGWSPAIPSTFPASDLTVTASWTWNEYSVWYYSEGSVFWAYSPLHVGDPVPLPPANPVRAGYTFTGWDPAVPPTYVTSFNTTVAQWQAIPNPTSTISFDMAGGTPSIAPITQDEGTAVTAPADPTKTGYTFQGWVPAIPATMPVDDVTCVAQWVANPQSTITFDLAGGTPSISPITQEEGTSVTAPADPTKTGFTFQGWIPAVPATMPVDDVTCVAQWEASTPCNDAGIVWTDRTAAEANLWSSVTYGNGLFVAVANDGTNRVMTSPDGITWTARTAAEANAWLSVTYGNDLFVAVTYQGANRVMTSPDGITWTARNVAASTWQSVTYGNGLFVAVASSGTNRVMTSTDGITWTVRNAAAANDWRSVTSSNGLFVAVAISGTNRVMTSPDGITWTARTAAEANTWYSVTYGNGLFVAVSYDGTNRVMTSPDGIIWTARTAAQANPWISVTYGNSLFVAVAYNGTNRVMTSPDGITWTVRAAAENYSWKSVTYGNGLFVAVAIDGTNAVMTSHCTTYDPSTITFNVDGGSAVAPITQTKGSRITAPSNPTKVGFYFTGWIPEIPTKMPVNDLTCVAQWMDAATGTIVVYGAGSTVVNGTYVYTEDYPIQGLTAAYRNSAATMLIIKWITGGDLPAGWFFINTAFNDIYYMAPLTDGVIPPTTGWQSVMSGVDPPPYFQGATSTSTITFDMAGGTPSISPITQDEGTAVTAPADPTKAGYTFDGWVPAVPATMPVDDITCVAQWTFNTATPQYYNYSTNGSNNSFPFGIALGKEVQLLYLPGDFTQPSTAPAGNISVLYFRIGDTYPINSLTYTDLTIKMGQSTITSFDEGTLYTGTLTTVYYKASVTLSATGGSWLSITLDNPFSYDPAESLIVDIGHCGAPGATGFPLCFTTLTNNRRIWSAGGCAFSYGGRDSKVYHIGFDIGGTTTPHSTITFDVAGGTPAIDPINQEEGSTVISPADPTKNGYTFSGWNPAVPATMPVDDVTCVAQWQANPILTVTTQAIGDITATSGIGNGTITIIGSGNATNRGIILYPYTDTDKEIGGTDVINVSETGDYGIGTFSATFTALSVNTRYNARAHATNTGDGTVYGSKVDFWTLANVPTAPTVNNPTFTSLDVTINVNSNPDLTEFAIHESTTNQFVQANGTLGATSVWQTAATWGTKTITDLLSDTQYTFEVKARNGNNVETAYGATDSGTTIVCFAGQLWTVQTPAEANQWETVTYGNGLFVALSSNGTNQVMTSPDGITWTACAAAEASNWNSVTYGNGQFVAVAGYGTNRVMTSPDGITWTAHAAAEANSWQSITYGNGLFVAVADYGTNYVMSSPDGITWTSHAAPHPSASVTYGDGLFVAVGGTKVMTSPDGVNWTSQTSATSHGGWQSVTYGNGLFVAAAYYNYIMTSPDGITWTGAFMEIYGCISITYGNGLFVAVAYEGQDDKDIMTSPDGMNWTTYSADCYNMTSVTYGNGLFVSVAYQGANQVIISDCTSPAITVSTQAASSISTTTVTGNGNITSIGSGNATNRGVIYYPYTGTDKEIGGADVTNVSETGDFGIGTFSATFTALSVNTRYNARAHATNTGDGIVYGSKVDFWTLANTPSAPTVDNPTATSLDVAVNVNGNPDITTFAINETSTTKFVQANGTLGIAEVWQTAVNWGTTTVTGLSTGLTYTFKVKARNGENVETAYGDETSKNTCSNPTEGGEIDGEQTVCYNTAADELGSVTEASNYGGTLEYQWLSSTISDGTDFTEIIGAATNTYSPGTLIQTSWFKRLARVSCKTDWIGAAESNVIKVTVDPSTVAGTISGNENITVHATTGDLTLSGQTGDVLQWEKKLNDGEWEIIPGTATATFSETPVTVGTWSYKALVQSGVCDSEYTDAHSITVMPAEPDHFILTSPGTATAGAASGNFVIALFDLYNNPTYCRANTTFNLSTNSTSSNHSFNPASPLLMTTGTYSSTFTYTDTRVGTFNITASYGSGSAGLSGESLTVQITIILPGPWTSANIGASNGTTEFFPEINSGTFQMTAKGLSAPKSDVMNYVYQPLCGTGTVIARLDDSENGGWAGVMMRENNAPGSKAVLFKTKLYNPSVIIGYRATTDAKMVNLSQTIQSIHWMKIQRSGNNFQIFTSYNGIAWNRRYTATVVMPNCIEAGFFTESIQANRTVTSWFDNAEVVGYLKAGEDEMSEIRTDEPFEISFYPNPANDQITIMAPENSRTIKVTLINANGSVVESDEFNSMDAIYNLQHIKPGVYLLRFERDGMIVNKRLVVL